MHHPSPNPQHPSNDLTGPSPQNSDWKRPVLITTVIVLSSCVLTALGTVWWVKRHVYASPLVPVQLTASEQSTFDRKLSDLQIPGAPSLNPTSSDTSSETRATEHNPRSLLITTREINAFLAKQGVGEQIKIDLAPDRVIANFLLPIDQDAPLFAGTTLRIRFALSAAMNSLGKLEIKVDDVSLGGIPIPNAWLGNIKGLDLMTSDLSGDPTLQRFAAGIKDFRIGRDELSVILNE